MLPTSASFLVTEDCNLRCSYCFEKHNSSSMTTEVARRGLEYLCENTIKNGGRSFHAMLFGGEPLLKPDIVEEILSYGLELAKRNRVNFTASMVTNATILTEEVKRIISTYKRTTNLNVQLSVDGIKEVHDAYRVTRGGKGSFDIIEKNIPQWKKLFSDTPDLLSIHGCSNKSTLPRLFENYLFFKEVWGLDRIWFMPIHSEEWDNDDVKIYDDQLSKIADYILDNAKQEKNLKYVSDYAPIDRCLRPDQRPESPCSAGKRFVTITANGQLYPCHQFYFNDPDSSTRIGDIWTGIDDMRRKLFVNYDYRDMSCNKEVSNCDCYGCYNCIAENWQQNGSILSIITGPRCEMSKVERSIQLRVREDLSNMGLLDKSNAQQTQGNNPNNPDCLCDSRGGNQQAPAKKESCSCVDKSENEEAFAIALKVIIDKLDALEKGQAYMLKKLIN